MFGSCKSLFKVIVKRIFIVKTFMTFFGFSKLIIDYIPVTSIKFLADCFG